MPTHRNGPVSSNVEAVEKPLFRARIRVHPHRLLRDVLNFCVFVFANAWIRSIRGKSPRYLTFLTSSCRVLRDRIATVGELLDVLHHAVELPLPIDFLLPAQREPVKPFVVSQVAEHRLHGGEAVTI